MDADETEKLNELLYECYNSHIEEINQLSNRINIITEIKGFYTEMVESEPLNLDYNNLLNLCVLHKIKICPDKKIF